MNNKLKDIKIENNIIYIYFILLSIYLYANTIEINYIKYKNVEDKEKYRLLLYVVFGVSLIITLYYSIENIKDLQEKSPPHIKNLKELSTIASILILIASIIILYIIYKDKDINIEVSP